MRLAARSTVSRDREDRNELERFPLATSTDVPNDLSLAGRVSYVQPKRTNDQTIEREREGERERNERIQFETISPDRVDVR